jgi:hypothetical protein
MKKKLQLMLALIVTQFTFGQAPLNNIKGIPMPFDAVEIQPTFPGGNEEFIKFVGKNFKTPDVEDLSGVLKVSFVVEVNGVLGEIKILQDPGYGTADEIKRVLRTSPKWLPGENGGKPVRVVYTLPITIRN